MESLNYFDIEKTNYSFFEISPRIGINFLCDLTVKKSIFVPRLFYYGYPSR